MSPITINATMPMRFHLPIVHYSLPPYDTRKRNITDAVPDATIARFTPRPAAINKLVSTPPGFAGRRVSISARIGLRPQLVSISANEKLTS